MKIEDIESFYNKNESKLHLLYEELENLIEGRICHSSILLLKIITELDDVENYLEIGVHNGGSAALMLTNEKIKNIYGVDLFEDMYDIDKHYSVEKYQTYQYFRRDNLSMQKTVNNLSTVCEKYEKSPKIFLIKGNSYYDKTEEEVSKVLSGQTLDLIHIDGDHTLDGVKNDFERYVKYLRPGGYLVFDDYHHEIIKNYVDNQVVGVQKVGKFKSHNTEAEQFLVRRVK